MNLPDPKALTESLDFALQRRTSTRRQGFGELMPALSSLLYSMRFAPSAGGLYPLRCYVALAGKLTWYEPKEHRLVEVEGYADMVRERAAGAMHVFTPPPAVLLLTEHGDGTREKYGEKAGQELIACEVGVLYGLWSLVCAAAGVGGCCLGPLAWNVREWPYEAPRGAFAVVTGEGA